MASPAKEARKNLKMKYQSGRNTCWMYHKILMRDVTVLFL